MYKLYENRYIVIEILKALLASFETSVEIYQSTVLSLPVDLSLSHIGMSSTHRALCGNVMK